MRYRWLPLLCLLVVSCSPSTEPGKSTVLALSDSTFADEVLKSDVPVLVDFWAPWCVPCRKLSPAIEAAAVELKGKVKVTKMDVDESPKTSEQYQIESLPTMALFIKGREVARRTGFPPGDAQELVVAWIRDELKKSKE